MGVPHNSSKCIQHSPIGSFAFIRRRAARPTSSRQRATRIVLARTSEGNGSNGGDGTNTRPTASEGDSYDLSSNPLGLLTLAIAGTMTAYQINDILEEPFWLEDTQMKTVSIIIPALNEESLIRDSIRSIRELDPPAHEIIVVDGGSDDRTDKLARQAGARVVTARRGRACQMNAGAEVARGDILCFVHADSCIPRSAVGSMRRALQDKRVVLGGFRTVIKDGERPLIFMTAHQFIKTFYIAFLFRPLSFLRGARLLFGDQTLFCRACDFRRAGGYASRLPIMEDADLCIRLHMAGPEPPHRGAKAMETATGGQQKEQQHLLPPWFRRRGKVIMVLHPAAQTSEGRLQAWGNMKDDSRAIHHRHQLVLHPAAQTSGRRLQAWGNLKATAVHFIIGISWYMGATPEQMKDLYARLYTDAYR